MVLAILNACKRGKCSAAREAPCFQMQVHVTKRPPPWATLSLMLQHLPQTGAGADPETRSGVTREMSKEAAR